MIRNRILKDYLEYARVHKFEEKASRRFLKEQMRTNAIHDNGIFKTFSFSEKYYDLTLDYIKIEDKDLELYPDMFEYRFATKRIPSSQTDDNTEYKDILESCIMYNETGEIDDKLKHEFEEIKKECVEIYNAIYTSINITYTNIDENSERVIIHYGYYFIKDEFINKIGTYDVIFGEAPLPYGEWFIDYFGPWPADRPRRKENIALSKDVEKALKNKGYGWCSAAICPERNTENTLKELKENKNMEIHLLIVPEGMNEEFVNNTKTNRQNNDNTTMYVSSNDVAFESNDKYKTKYDLLEYWVKSGMIYCVEFMIGYENDPEAKAFEAFIRGIKISSTTDKVNLRYQKDTIERVIDNLRSDYNKSSIIKNNFDSITDTIMDKVRFFKDYGLDDDDLNKIRNANFDKDACFAAVHKMTEIAFASDKKGNKKK